jgi:hypothetical protein
METFCDMFPLAGKNFPQDADELAASLRDALAEVVTLPKPDAAVQVDGNGFPQLEQVKVDLSGAQISASEPPPKPKPSGKRQPGVSVANLVVIGRPIKYEQNKLDLSLTARQVTFDFARDKEGQPLLVLTGARDGHVEANFSKGDIESLLLTVARDLAEQQKVDVQSLKLNLKSDGTRSLAADVRITAKKMFVTSTIQLRGRADVDDELNVTLSDLTAEGDGMVGKLVASVVQKKIKPLEGKAIPLMAFSLGDVTLRDLKISVTNDVLVSAHFGSGA